MANRFVAEYVAKAGGWSRFRREVKATREEIERLDAVSSSSRNDTVRENREVQRSQIDAARASRAYREEVSDTDRELTKLNKTQRSVSRTTKDVDRDLRDTGRTMRRAGNDGNGLNRIFLALGGSMGRARQEGKNFGAVLRLLKFPAIIAAVHTLIGALSALAAGLAALIPNLAQVSTLLAGIPGLIAAAAQGIGVAVLGFVGLGDAVKALSDAQSAGAENARRAADTRRQAASSEQSAIEAVADAEEALADAQANERDAVESLTEAREEALEALQDLRIEAERASLGEEQARINLERARRELRAMMLDPDVSPDDLEFREAQLAVQEAELDLKDARNQNKRTTDDLRDAEKKGIAQSDIMVAARERLADATEAVSDAEDNLADAIANQSEVMRDNREAMAGMTSEQEKMREAFRALSPEARSFARFIFSLRDRLDELRKTSQRGILPGAEDGLRAVMGLFPIVQDMVANTSSIIGRFFRRLGTQLSSTEFSRDFQTIFRTNEFVIERAGFALQDFLDTMRNLIIGARPVVVWITRITERFFEWTSRMTEAGRESGRMQEFFQRAIETAEQMGRIIRDVAIGVFNFFNEGAEVGQRLWDSIEEGAESFRNFTEQTEGKNKMREWFERAEPIIRNVVGLVGDLAKAFFTLAGDATSGLNPLITAIRSDLVPAIVDLGKSVAESFGPEIIRLLTNIARAFEIIGGQSGSLTIFLKVINNFIEAVLKLIDLVPGLNGVISALFLLGGAAAGLKFLGTVLRVFVWANLVKVANMVGGIIALTRAIGAVGLVGALQAAGGAGAAFAGVIVRITQAIGLFKLATAGGATNIGALGLALKSLISPTGLLVGAIALAGVALVKLKNYLELPEQQAKVWFKTLKSGKNTMAEFTREQRKLQEEVGSFEGLGDIASGNLAAIDAIDNLREKFVAAANDIGDARLQNAEAEERWREAIIGNENLTLDQMRHLAGLTNTVYEYGEGLDAAEQKQLDAALAAGKYDEAVAILRDQFDQGEVSLEGWTKQIGFAAAGAEAFDRAVSNNEEPLRNFARLTGRTYQEFLAEGREAFSQSIEAGEDWVEAQRQMLRDYRQEWRDTFDVTDEVWQDLAQQSNVTSGEIVDAFEDQLDILTDYQANWRELARRGAPKKFLEELASMGLEGAQIVEGLADSNEEEFDRVVGKWKESQELGKSLGDTITEDLGGSIKDLDRTLRQLVKVIKISLGIDTSKAREGMRDFIQSLKDRGLSLEEFRRRKGGTLAKHSGGTIGEGPGPAGTPAGDGPPKAGEVDIRAQRGEYMFDKKTVTRAGGPRAMARLHKGIGRLPRFHEGGFVGDMDKVTSRLQLVREGLDATRIKATLARRQRFLPGERWAPAGPEPGAAGGGGTSAMNAFHKWALKTFNISGRLVALGPGRKIGSTGTISQHAYGNAVDYFGRASEMMRMFRTVVALAEKRSIRNLGHIIHAMKVWSFNNQTVHPYDVPAGGSTHYDHVHVDMLPQLTGWPGRAVPPSSYAYGGRVDRDKRADVHRDEFVMRARAARAVGYPTLKAMNALGGSPFQIRNLGPTISVPRVSPIPSVSAVRVSDGQWNEAGERRPDGVTLIAELDGKTIHETHRIHERETRLRVGGRHPSKTSAGNRR